ncbi:hypothetical protein F5878DRAFT_343931 [Lentinula raphanica]|uniref:Uncharacterized protein n=1 Tax=Lentinula raphanica TaxID=153919 RepID=A0AA38P1Z0_9AGAR|nr:hypothetical protein F5878DRAFT_343931 [Lentinula raphanica]
MRRCLPLPNELLHTITEYVAYAPNLPESWFTSFESLSKSASPNLLALSVVDWRLRRICLPFLFANITLKNDEHAKQLENNLALCSRFTDTLVIGRLPALTEIGETIISRLLPQMERLVNVELPECEDRTNLLKALLAHPTVALVLVDQTPSMAMCNHDLSKVTLDLTTSAMAFSLICHKYLDWGMRIKRVILDRPVGNQLEFQKVPGLKSIEVSMHFVPISILSSCLSPFLSTHPTLNELRLFYLHRPFFTHDAPPFLSPLIKDYQRQGLHDCFMITELRLSRIKSAGQSSQEWHVMELALDVKSSLTEKLPLVASSFPKLEVLHLNLQYDKGMYDINDLSSALGCFSSLSIVYPQNFRGRLTFKPSIARLMLSIQRDSTLDEMEARARTELFTFASCLVKQVRTLDSVYIDEQGIELDNFTHPTGEWFLEGWLNVINSNRELGGSLMDKLV